MTTQVQEHLDRAADLAKRYKRKARAIQLIDAETGHYIDTVAFMRAGCGGGAEYWYVPGDEALYFNSALAEFNDAVEVIKEEHGTVVGAAEQEAARKETYREFYNLLKRQIKTKLGKPYSKDEQQWSVGDVVWAVHVMADIGGKQLTQEVLKLLTKQMNDPGFWRAVDTSKQVPDGKVFEGAVRVNGKEARHV